jgi:putative CocE/NonD family hydrolase
MVGRQHMAGVGFASIVLASAAFFHAGRSTAQTVASTQAYLDANYTREQYTIPMRDGVHLFTVVYTPNDVSKEYPILLERTAFGANVYGGDYHRGVLGPSLALIREGYIIARQEIRGTYGSGGRFSYLRPHMGDKRGKAGVDESTDTYDTIEWLLGNIPHHNGRVGIWGIDYSGFTALAGMIDAHPALKAVSPQAPVTDYWKDSFHTGGAFNLLNALKFTTCYGELSPDRPARYHLLYLAMTGDSFAFLLNVGPLSYIDRLYLQGRRPFWNEFVDHPNYDEHWRSRNVLPHLSKTAPAVMTVGGWFDDRNLHGPLACYRAIEEKNPGIFNCLVMGPWGHAGWLGDYESMDGLGDIAFGSNPAEYFQENIELNFFEYYLKDRGRPALPEAFVFETGTNRWRAFDRWPPRAATPRKLFLQSGGSLSFEAPRSPAAARDEFVSDPANPVPVMNHPTIWLPTDFMVQDQRFLLGRKDVLIYQSDPLEEDVAVAGPLEAVLWVSTTRGDADWVVKLIDVFPPEGDDQFPNAYILRGYQAPVRIGVLRGRFRSSAERPEPFRPNEPARISVELGDICHKFRRGHRIMVHIQSSWFPYIDRNPQKYVPNIFKAAPEDFVEATHRVYRSLEQASCLQMGVLPAERE